jgi:hypothetical protein
VRALALLATLAACKSREAEDKLAPALPVEVVRDGGVAADAAPSVWPELEKLPLEQPLRVITLPAKTNVPRFDVGGPAVLGDLAVVASSQLGFAAVDWRRGTLAWTKPSGPHVAPPVVRDGSFVLIGDCLTPPQVPAANLLLGCLRVVTPAGEDQAYVAIHGKQAAVEAFAEEPGQQRVFVDGDKLRWVRGEAAVSIDPISGVATPASIEPPPIVVEHGGKRWDIAQEDGKIVARQKGKIAWQTEHEVGTVLGSVWLPDQRPMIRSATISGRYGTPEVRLLDIDATGSLNGTAAWTPVPGIALLGQAISPVGDVALAIRMDKSIKRDYIAAYAANALLIYVYPLPQVMRPDPVGVAIALDAERAPEAVVVFHDGDLVTVLPTVSSPPTAPGAASKPSQNPTP